MGTGTDGREDESASGSSRRSWRWRTETPYPADTDWVFASPFTEGKRLYWAESAMTDHIRPLRSAPE